MTTEPTKNEVPMGSAAAAAAAGNDTYNHRSIRGLVIGIVVCDSICLLFWILAYLLPFLAFIGLVALLVSCVMAFIIPCKNKEGLTAQLKKSCRGVFLSHLMTLIFYIVTIALIFAAYGMSAAGTSQEAVGGMAIGGLAMNIVTLIALLVALVLASVLLRKLNRELKK